MRWILFFQMFLVSACTSQMTEFSFLDVYGREYRSFHLKEDFLAHYKLPIEPYLVLIEAPNARDALVKKQYAALDKLDTEASKLVLVTAYREEENLSGFYVPLNEIKRSLNRRTRFQVTILSPTGEILLQSSQPVSADTLVQTTKQPSYRLSR